MGWLKDKIKAFKAQRQLAKQIDPHNFKKMALEIRNLAALAAQITPHGKDIQRLIRNSMAEMDKLCDLANRPEFRRLSTGKKLILRQGLIESKEQLLESIESAPSPTDTLQ